MSRFFSLSEIDSQCRKAVRGAGYSWGLAEEAGKAVRWLAARGLPGPEALAELLPWIDGVAPKAMTPDVKRLPWHGGAPMLCPIIAGAALNDRAGLLKQRGSIEIGPVFNPLLLVAQAGKVAEAERVTIDISWPGAQIQCGPDLVTVIADETLLAGSADRVVCALSGYDCRGHMAKIGSREVAMEIWDLLACFAHRTYAPATEQSRLSGAGAGLSDIN